MPQVNKMDITVFPADQSGIDIQPGGYEFLDVNFVSFVSSPGGGAGGTYGIPAIISEDKHKRDGLPLKVLYVNPANIAAMQVVRKA